jgi:predicted ATPase
MTLPATDRFFIVTSGPGSGKSTLIDALAARGISSMPEAGRAIIQD